MVLMAIDPAYHPGLRRVLGRLYKSKSGMAPPDPLGLGASRRYFIRLPPDAAGPTQAPPNGCQQRGEASTTTECFPAMSENLWLSHR
ncbi:hypothetical protein JZ751_007915 [Albula glossodonta]|uniref:Uncharacterized protein n=1 Tax=Albula glossodonta TaxID=121402 RepID=A0A8T2PBM4_9TELE|nr:hypothetical protein JZ751_007915 [Albula glossodonta]